MWHLFVFNFYILFIERFPCLIYTHMPGHRITTIITVRSPSSWASAEKYQGLQIPKLSKNIWSGRYHILEMYPIINILILSSFCFYRAIEHQIHNECKGLNPKKYSHNIYFLSKYFWKQKHALHIILISQDDNLSKFINRKWVS